MMQNCLEAKEVKAKEVTGRVVVDIVVTTVGVVGMLVLSPKPGLGRTDRLPG